MLPLQPITGSSNIKAAAYDPAARVLSIQFASGANRFDYQDVPPDVGAAFMAAESKGKFHATQILHLYHFEKVDTLADEDARDDDKGEGEPIVTKGGLKIDPRAAWPFPDKARA